MPSWGSMMFAGWLPAPPGVKNDRDGLTFGEPSRLSRPGGRCNKIKYTDKNDIKYCAYNIIKVTQL